MTEIVIIAALVVILIVGGFFGFLSFLFNIALGVVAYRASQNNLAMQEQNEIYRQYFTNAFGILRKDFNIVSTELMQKYLTSNLPEVAEFSAKLRQFASHLYAIEEGLRRFGFLNEDDYRKDGST